MSSERVFHTLPPVFDAYSRVLILGTMPSPKSRELGFYYMHPQNRFWKILSEVLGEQFPQTKESRQSLCIKNNIALWDVLASCDINGSSDCSIKNAVPNDLNKIFGQCEIRAVFTTGKKAHKLYRRFFPESMPDICLPSTSPANRTVTDEEILREYRKIAEVVPINNV